MDVGIVVVEGHLVAAFLRSAAVVVVAAAWLRLLRAPSDLQPVPRLGPGVEVRVPPALGWNENGSWSPIDPHRLVAGRADEDGVAVAADRGDVDTGAVSMEGGVRARLGAEAQAGMHGAVQHDGAAALRLLASLQEPTDCFPALASLGRC